MTLTAKQYVHNIEQTAADLGNISIMELCGTHSQTVAQNNLKSLLPKNIKLVSGPGCPICVTDQTEIDLVVELAKNDIPLAIYGDALSLPGSEASLEDLKQQGKHIFTVYSVADALTLQKDWPNIVLFGIGFETTAPMTAWAIQQGLNIFSSHKYFPPAMSALLASEKINIDGFIDPGHVSAIIGTQIFQQFKIPQVISGFEALDMLETIDILLKNIKNQNQTVVNQYKRAVNDQGNLKAQKLLKEVFENRDTNWRGLGMIPKSGMKIKAKYQKNDAEYIYRDLIEKFKKTYQPRPSACRCGEILQGLITPGDCPLFKKICTPENPQGACMVSVEGTCRITYENRQ